MKYFKKSLALLTVITLLFVSLFSFSTVSAEEITADDNVGGLIPITPITPPGEDDEPDLPNNLPETDPIEDGAVYRIKNLQTGRYLTLEPNSSGVYDRNLNNIATASNNGSSAQEFRIVDDFGVYYIKSIESSNGTNRQLDVNSTSIAQIVDGANVHLYAPGDENSSQWLIEYNSTLGSYVIKIACKPNLALTDANGNAQINNFSTGNTAQYWIFERVESDPDINSGDIYRIRDLNSGLYVSVSGNDANLSNVALAMGSVALINQQFRIVYDVQNEVYYIKAAMSSNGNNRLLDINSTASSPPTNGRNVHIYEPGDMNSSTWQIIKIGTDANGNEIVTMVSDYNNSLALTAANGGTAVGTNVQVNTYTEKTYQKWVLEKHQSGIYNVPTQGTFDIGETAQLTIPPYITNPVWVSSNPNIAEVSDTGSVLAKGYGNCKIYAYNSTQTVIEASCDIAINDSIVGELTIFADVPDGNLGHAFVSFKNTTTITLNLNNIIIAKNSKGFSVLSNEEISIGTYHIGSGSSGTSSSGAQNTGVLINADSYSHNHPVKSFTNLVSLTINITYSDLLLISSYIIENDRWSTSYTCATFATGLWNTVSDIQLASTVYPSALRDSIKQHNQHETGRALQDVNCRWYMHQGKIYDY